ncbi:MAG: CinA family protein [Nitrospirae bacterium]|nr:CinA family protein [Nitrospirota bacterium]
MQDIAALAERVVEAASKRCKTIAVAESCTGGMIAAAITSVAGSSRVFLGGVVSYSNELKELFLNVSRETLISHGAVSPQTALQMVRGIASRTNADLAVAVTGIAGPSGGTIDKPVGLVYISVKGIGGVEAVHEFRFTDDRQEIRGKTTTEALRLLFGALHRV